MSPRGAGTTHTPAFCAGNLDTFLARIEVFSKVFSKCTRAVFGAATRMAAARPTPQQPATCRSGRGNRRRRGSTTLRSKNAETGIGSTRLRTSIGENASFLQRVDYSSMTYACYALCRKME